MSKNLFIYPIEDVAALLPHSGHMVLLERVTEYSKQHICAEAFIGDNHILLVNGVLPCIASIEIMAQGIGAYAGISALNAGEKVKLGFLLGTRKLDLFVDSIPIGSRLKVKVQLSIQDTNGMGVFDCELYCLNPSELLKEGLPSDGLLAKASLNVYSPKEQQAV